MKKLTILPLIVLIWSSSGFNSCSSGKSKDSADIANSQGWIDDNTFIISAIGRPIKTYKTQSSRQDSAKRAAIINAHFKILKKFKKISKKDQNAVIPKTEMVKALQIKDIIKKGKPVKELYDNSDNCEIIFKIRYQGLKKLIEETDLSGIDVIN